MKLDVYFFKVGVFSDVEQFIVVLAPPCKKYPTCLERQALLGWCFKLKRQLYCVQ